MVSTSWKTSWLPLIIVLLQGSIKLTECQEIDLLITPPGPLIKTAGSNIYVICEITGVPPGTQAPLIQWRRFNGDVIIATSGRVFIEKESDYKQKLYIRSFSAVDSGPYMCDGFHEGETYEAQIQLQIYEDISFMETPTRYTVLEGQEIMLPCTAYGTPQPEISWRFNLKKVPPNTEKYRYLDKGLLIKHLGPEDMGRYDCRAEVFSQGNIKIRYVNLDIQYGPSIVQPPNNTATVYGANITLTCIAKGNPPVFYEWKKEVYADDEHTRYKVTVGRGRNKTSLVIPRVGKHDIGKYFCEASNPIAVTTAIADVTRLISPYVDPIPKRVQIAGDMMILSCTVSGQPTPKIRWQKVGNQYPYWNGTQRSDPRINVEQVSQSVSRLTINNIKLTDSGEYTCNATNAAGSDAKRGILAVEFPPQMKALENSALAWGGQTRTFNCTATGVPEPTITWYRHNEYVIANETYTILGQKGTSLLQINILEKERWLYGDYTCTAKNHHGHQDLTFTLEEARAPGKPHGIYVVHQTSSEVTLQANTPRRNGGLPITQWMISFGRATEKSVKKLQTLFFSIGDKLRVQNLEAGIQYNFYLSSGNAVGFGKPVLFKVKTSSQNIPSIRIGISENPLSGTHDGRTGNGTGFNINEPDGKRADVLRAKSTTDKESSGINIVMVGGGGVVGVLLLIICVVTGVMCKRRSKRGSGDGAGHTVLYQKKNGPEMKIVHVNGHADKLHIEIPRNQTACSGSPVANVQHQTATLSRRSPQPPRSTRVMNGTLQSNGGASILAVVEGESSLPGVMYQGGRDSTDSTTAIDCMSNLNTLQRQAWEEMITHSATAPDSAAGEAIAVPQPEDYSAEYRPHPQLSEFRARPNEYSPDPAALPPPPPFLLSGNNRLPPDGATYNEILDGYHSEENIDDDIEPIRSDTKLNLKSPAQQMTLHHQQQQQQQLLQHQHNLLHHRNPQAGHMNEERMPLNHNKHVTYT